jgi:predicted ATPase/DNA-binding CsgD family transcriptional regulator
MATVRSFPPQLTTFVGREAELDDLARLLADPTCPLLTLVGPGGIGKTRLAMEAAGRQRNNFPNGVSFISLAPLNAVENIIPAVAQALDLQFHIHETPEQQILDFLREKTTLLVFDNFEHLLDGAALLATILDAAPGVSILATSRQALNLHGERLYHVRELSFPSDERTDDLDAFDAVQLFTERSRRAWPDFSLPDERRWVIRICRLVEGMPLAIELAAAWVKTLSCEDIAHEIERSLNFLATNAPNVAERHRSVRAVLDHSWRLLSDEEQAVFARLSVFWGGFRREAAEQVAGASLPVLAALVDKSLLRRGRSGRYETHELLREYAREKLAESPGAERETRDRHCDFFAEFLQRLVEPLMGGKQKEALETIEAELENVRVAWRWAGENHRLGAIEMSLESLWLFYYIRSRSPEGEEIFWQMAEALGPDSMEEQDQVLRAHIRARWAWFRDSGEKARQALLESEAIFRRMGARRELAFCLIAFCWASPNLSEMLEVQPAMRESLAISQAVNDPWGAVLALRLLGHTTMIKDNPEEVRRFAQESLEICRKTDNRFGMQGTLILLGDLAIREGKYGEAKTYHLESLAIFRELGSRFEAMLALNDLGNIARDTGELEAAREYYQESLALARDIGARSWTGWLLVHLSRTAHELGNYAEAKDFSQQGLAMFQTINDQKAKAWALFAAGHAACGLREYAEAKAHLQTSLAIHREFADRRDTAYAMSYLAAVMQEAGEAVEARQLQREAVAEFRDINEQWGMAYALEHLGKIACAFGDFTEARQDLMEALSTAMRIRVRPVILDTLIGVTMLLMKDEEVEWAVELLELVLHHPSSWKLTKDAAERLLLGPKEILAPHLFSTAITRASASPLEEVVEALLRGERYVPAPEPNLENASLIEPLSERELEVLRLMAAGLSNQEIARQLTVALSTVKVHAGNIYGKLNVNSRTQAVARARELNLLA